MVVHWKKQTVTSLECSKCNSIKPISEYYKKTGQNGYSHICKSCKNQITSDYRRRVAADKGSVANYRFQLSLLKKRAKRRGYSCFLTLDKFSELKDSPCYYCDARADFTSIDRVDNSIGYRDDNCVAACLPCNRLKHAIPYEMFKRVVEFVESQ